MPSYLKAVLTAASLAVAVGCSSSSPVPSPTSSSTLETGSRSASPFDSGIKGTVEWAPTCPGGISKCAPEFVAGAPTDILTPSGDRVARVVSDADGRFTVRLKPGEYIVRTVRFKPTNGGAPTVGSKYLEPQTGDQQVSVQAHRFVRVKSFYESGIL